MRGLVWAGVMPALALVIAGCQPAGKYGPPVTIPAVASMPTTKTAPQSTVTEKFAWEREDPSKLEPSVSLVFVHRGSNPKGWDQLQKFMTHDPPLPPPGYAPTLLGLNPWTVAALVSRQANRVVKVKVPLGIDDPTPFIPLSNLPTFGKWELGKKLFFEREGFLELSSGGLSQSCAGCHIPSQGYTDRLPTTWTKPLNPPTILNTVYNAYQFWDGRATALEEVVQRTLDDERGTPGTLEFRHSWPGIVGRLQKNPFYQARFLEVFGTPPTQDAIGKALATYMRTVLTGGSIHDKALQAMRERKGSKGLDVSDYQKVLTDDKTALQALFGTEGAPSSVEAAKQLFNGYALFHGKARCTQCHKGNNYTDAALGAGGPGFHNLLVRDSGSMFLPRGKETGRFAALPAGLKDQRMIGAYKTPTLRALPRTLRYFHDGSMEDLAAVVRWHITDAPRRGGPLLDPDLPLIALQDDEVKALVLFLKALDGEAMPPILYEQ